MSRYSLDHLADDSLLDALQLCAERNRECTADLLAHIGEVQRRRLYGPLGFSSMLEYCVEVLHLSHDAAKKRVQVARKGTYLPEIFEAIADGRVHLTGMNLLVPFIDDENVEELIEAATYRTKAEIELYLAGRYPLPEAEAGAEALGPGAPAHLRNRSSVKPIAPGRRLVQFVIGEDEYERLQYGLQLMSHRNPKGDLAFFFLNAQEQFIEDLEKDKFGSVEEPAAADSSSSSQTRYVPRAVAREVWKRDGGRCTYVSSSGRRCECRWRLEFDHIEPFALGGRTTAANLRLLCPAHNQLEADRRYGATFMERKRTEARQIRLAPDDGPSGGNDSDREPAGIGVAP